MNTNLGSVLNSCNSETAIKSSSFKRDEVARTLAYLTPVISSLMQVTDLIKSLHALHHYQGSPHAQLEESVSRPASPRVIVKFMTSRVGSSRFAAPSKVGYGTSWDRYASGDRVDRPVRRRVAKKRRFYR